MVEVNSSMEIDPNQDKQSKSEPELGRIDSSSGPSGDQRLALRDFVCHRLNRSLGVDTLPRWETVLLAWQTQMGIAPVSFPLWSVQFLRAGVHFPFFLEVEKQP